MKLGAPGSSVFCSASKAATSEPTSSLPLSDKTECPVAFAGMTAFTLGGAASA